MLPAEPNEGDSHVTTEVAGTLGYLDPAWSYTLQLSVKSDVYSLGIVLLQLITRRRVVDYDYSESGYINDLVKDVLVSGGIRRLKEELMDPLLRDSVLVGFERFLALAFACLQYQDSQRPSMREVVKELESILDMDMETETETETEGFFQFSPQLRRDNSYNDIDSSSSIEVDISPQPRPEDVGPYQPPGTSPIQRRGEVAPVPPWDAEDYEAVEQNLEGLTANIPDMLLGEVPRRYQRHTVGVLESIGRLLRRVARAIVCYY
uniref:Protein kinase domain-containing protein n=1 Tax=Picea sitchensis TaxID=3332 RepID=D5A8T6_PICSI|nr:unknown [Picea sitchensis]